MVSQSPAHARGAPTHKYNGATDAADGGGIHRLLVDKQRSGIAIARADVVIILIAIIYSWLWRNTI